MEKWLDWVSYNLWSQFSPAVGKENWHCDQKRGYARAKKKEPEVKKLLETDNIPQRIGILAQQVVWEFYQQPQLLSQTDGVEKVAAIIQLNRETVEVEKRVFAMIKEYYRQPFLLDKTVVHLNRGDEGFPDPILIELGEDQFNLFAAIDCVIREADNTIHIVDFKTGRTDFDRRQAYVYLLASQYLYPKQSVIASFYNLETHQASEAIRASDKAIEWMKSKLYSLAKQHGRELKQYRIHPDRFNSIFPPNPGSTCHYCAFNSICQFSATAIKDDCYTN